MNPPGWEYKVLLFDTEADGALKDVRERLNVYAKDGWELAATEVLDHQQLLLFLRKPL